MALDGFKWDVQIGDSATLAPFAIVLPRTEWETLATAAEALTAEFVAAETELVERSDLWPELGLPKRILRALQTSAPWTPAAARAIRFDFHPTEEGWRISEANSDVPGGYTEASRFTAWMQPHVSGAETAGDPSTALCTALAESCGELRRIALLAAPGYIDDQQIIAYLAAELRARDIETCLGRPEQVEFVDEIAHLHIGGKSQPLGAIFRFYQGEWMTRLRGDGWHGFFRGSRTPVCNPGSAVLSESKRLPLIWDRLRTPMTAWKQFLPVTRAASAAWFEPANGWVLKAAYGNTGGAVFSRAWSSPRDYWSALAHSVATPRGWLAQEHFTTTECETPLGPMRPCLGVYTVNGCATGIYGRLTHGGWIDFTATDVAVFVET